MSFERFVILYVTLSVDYLESLILCGIIQHTQAFNLWCNGNFNKWKYEI